MLKLDVMCLGTTAVDVMAKPVDRMPEAGTQVLFDGLSIHPGGGALNQAVGLARLGVKVGLAAKVGRDLFGDFLLDTLRSEGVDTSSVIRAKDEATCFTFAPVQSDGKRRYFSCLGTNATFRASEFTLPAASCQLLAVGGVSVMPKLDGKPLAGILKAARARGAITTVDTAFNSKLRDWKPLIKPLLPHANYFFPSIEEARLITGEKTPEGMIQTLQAWGGRGVGVKVGPKGVLFRERARRDEVPVPSLPLSLTLPHKGGGRIIKSRAFKTRVVDTSGAGDAFMAGFILGLLDGRPVEECLVRGNAMAAHCIQAVGCTAGLPNRSVLMSFLKRR